MTGSGQPPIHDSRYCGGKKKQGEGLCERPAGWGTDHAGAGRCKLHGGCAPSGSKSGHAELVELVDREVRELFGKVAPEPAPVRNPLAAYAAFAGRVMAWMDLMDRLLDDLRVVGYESEYAGVQIQAVVQLYERAMDRANAVLSSYARLRIDERLAAITSKQADAVIAAIEAGLNAAGVRDPGQRALARGAASRELRAVK
jgi:hypothetical protein